MSVPSLREIKSVFKLIGSTKSAQHLVNEKLSTEQRIHLHTMDEFFRIVNSDRFDGMAQIQYKDTDGYDYFLNNLKKLLASSIDEYVKSKHGTIKRSELGIPKDAFVVGMVGRICQQKSPDIFIRAAKRIKEVIPNTFFVIVGDGELRSEIIDYARENALLDNLYITGCLIRILCLLPLFGALGCFQR